MELKDVFSSTPLAVSTITFLILMTIVAISIIVRDTKKLSVKMWQLFLFVGIGFVGVFVTRAIDGVFNPIWLICVPIYAVLNIANTFLNHNKLIGQADVDILNGLISIAIPTLININMQDYGDENTALVNQIHMANYGSEIVVFFIAGIILSVAIFLIKLAMNDKKWLVVDIILALINIAGVVVSSILENPLIETIIMLASFIIVYVYSKLSISGTTKTIKNMYYPSGIAKDELTENDIKDDPNAKTKMPICVAFMPAFMYAIYYAMLLDLVMI